MNNLSVPDQTNKGNDEKENKIEVNTGQQNKKKFYDSENNLVLPRSAECYFNWKSSQSDNVTHNTRLKELGYLLAHGFKLKDFIDDYKSDRDSYTISSISQTFIFYIMYIRYKDYYHFISEILSTLSENKLIQIFLYELNLVYDPLEDDITCMFWNDNDVMKAAKALEGNQSEKEKLIEMISTGKMVKASMTKEKEKEKD
jgi:hypothetical protein